MIGFSLPEPVILISGVAVIIASGCAGTRGDSRRRPAGANRAAAEDSVTRTREGRGGRSGMALAELDRAPRRADRLRDSRRHHDADLAADGTVGSHRFLRRAIRGGRACSSAAAAHGARLSRAAACPPRPHGNRQPIARTSALQDIGRNPGPELGYVLDRGREVGPSPGTSSSAVCARDRRSSSTHAPC